MKTLDQWKQEIREKMRQGQLFDCGHRKLAWCVEQSPKQGMVLEFGTYSGSTLATIAVSTERMVYSFDGYYGLPHAWNNDNPKGKFNCDGKPPFSPDHLPPNTKLVIGWFEETLEDFLATHPGEIAFMHMDADLYGPTKYVLDKCGSRLADACVICFNEFSNYTEAEAHEFKAFCEWLHENDFRTECIARTECAYGQNAFQVFRNKEQG